MLADSNSNPCNTKQTDFIANFVPESSSKKVAAWCVWHCRRTLCWWHCNDILCGPAYNFVITAFCANKRLNKLRQILQLSTARFFHIVDLIGGKKMAGNSNGRQTEGLFLISTLLPNHTSTNTKSTTSTDRPIQDGHVRRTWRIDPHVRPVCELQTYFSGWCENAAADPFTLLCISCIWLKSCFLKLWFLVWDFWIFTSSWAVI